MKTNLFYYMLLLVTALTSCEPPANVAPSPPDDIIHVHDFDMGLNQVHVNFDARVSDEPYTLTMATLESEDDEATCLRADWDFITLTQFTNDKGWLGVRMDVDLDAYQRVDLYYNERYMNMAIVGHHCRNRTIAGTMFDVGDYFHIRVTNLDTGEQWEEGIRFVGVDQ